jgi:N-acetylmuramoyl-L-alanine amidase
MAKPLILKRPPANREAVSRLVVGAQVLRTAIFLTTILALSSWMLFSASADEKRLTIYSNVASYSLQVIDREGQEYVGLLEAIEPLGSVSANADGSTWRLRYNATQSEFTANSSRARIRGSDVDLHAPFLLENGRGLTPLASLGSLMSHILGGPVTLHESSRRVFVGSVAIHFTAQMSKSAPPTLVMNFTGPVNPMIATEPGKLLMVFGRDPLVAPGSPTLTFDSKTIPAANFEEENGAAAISVTGTTPLFASFSNGNRTITIAAASQPETSAGTRPPPPPQPLSSPVSAAGLPAQPSPAAPSTALPVTSYFAVVDASHGGADLGEDMPRHVQEKDVTLNLARALRQELQARGISTLLIRDGSMNLNLDQRASITNQIHPAIYICVHASSQGRGVRLYTALLPAGGQNVGTFVDWDTAQSTFLPLSQVAVAGVETEFQKKQVPVRVLMAPLRPLNNIATAALAVEVAGPPQGTPEMNLPAYQQLVAASVANGVALVRGKLEAER